MLKTPAEFLSDLGEAIRARRIALDHSQQELARRAGIGVRTLRRLETEGRGTIESLINAAIALRCEDEFGDLFPLPPARGMDQLQQQRETAEPKRPQRARTRKAKRS
jgi:transcriptional regulator with XRE-family HTH domain